MTPADLDQTFQALRKLLKKHAKGLVQYDKVPGSTAKGNKPGLHLYGAKEVSIAGRRPQQTYVAGIIQQKGYVGFYHMPVYSHPQEFALSEDMETARKGKSCFHIKQATPEILAELERLLTDGIALYRREGWI